MVSLGKRRAGFVAIAAALLLIVGLSAVTVAVVGSRQRDGSLKFSLGQTRVVMHLELITRAPKWFWKPYRTPGTLEVYALFGGVYFDLQMDWTGSQLYGLGKAPGVTAPSR